MDERPYFARGMLLLLGIVVATIGIFAILGVPTFLALGAAIDPPNPPPASRPLTPVRVALLHPGRENDRGWNQLAYDSLMKLGKEPGVSVKHLFTASKSTYKSDMRTFAQQGYDLVICHGGEYIKAAKDVAPGFSRTHFVVTGSDEAGDGVATLDFQLWEATYLCGVLAAHLVPAGPAGLIGGQDFRTVRQTLDAFANGARSVRPNYPTYSQYVGSWDDVAKATQSARSLIDGHKVRVLFQNCDAAAFGVFQAADEAKIVAFGCNSDQNAISPQRVAASAVIDMTAAFEQLVETVRAGRFEARPIRHNLKTGGIRFVPNPKLEAQWPKGAAEAVNSARNAIQDGKLDVLKSN